VNKRGTVLGILPCVVIANAPNPAGISLLKKYFDNGVSAAGLLGGAIVPTVIVFAVFLLTA